MVTVVALVVAFGSSSLRQSAEGELLLLRHRMEQLQRDNQSLEEKIRWAEGRCAQTLTLGRRLNEALLEEQKRSRTLAERLRQAVAAPGASAHRLRQAVAAPGASAHRLRRYSERSGATDSVSLR